MNELFKKVVAGITTLAMIITFVPVAAFAVVDAPIAPEGDVVITATPRFAAMTAYVNIEATGANVRALQAVLVAEELLVADNAEVVAGRYGESTRDAVIAFKRAHETAIEATLTTLRRQLDAEGKGQLAFTPYVGTATMRQVNAIVTELNAVAADPVVVAPTVAISARTPAARTVPRAATMVPVLEFNLTAGTEDLAVSEMAFRRTGVGRATDFGGLFIFQEGIRINEFSRALMDETVSFIALRNVVVPAGRTHSFVLKANIRDDATVGNESSFQLTSITAGDLEVEGLPITGNAQRIGAVRVARVDLLLGTAVANQLIGSQNVEIANFRIRADDAPALVKEILVGIRGTVSRGEVTNLRLVHRDKEVATAVRLAAQDRLVFVINEGVAIAEGATETFSIRADIRGRGRETVLVYVTDASDIIALDRNLGFGSVVVHTPMRIGSQTLTGGDLVIHAANPVAGNIARGGDDVVIAGARLLSQRDLEIRNVIVDLAFAGGLSSANIRDLRIKDAATGVTLARMTGALGTTNTIIGNLFLTGRTERTVQVTVDVANVPEVTTPTGQNVTATIRFGAPVDIRDLEIGAAILAEDIINPTIRGNVQTIVEAGARIALLGLPANATIITGETGVGALGFSIAATGAEVTLNRLVAQIRASAVNTFATTVDAATVVTRATLLDGTTVLGTATVRAGGMVTFDGLNLRIPVDTFRNLSIQIDVAAGLPARFVAVTIDPANISLVDAERNIIPPIGTTINPVGGVTPPTRFVTILSVGTLAVDRYPNTPISAIIPAGTVGATGVPMVTARLDADREAMIVRDVRVDIRGTPAAVSTVDLFYGGAVVATRVVPAGAADVTFTGLNINVPVTGTHNLTARANIFGVGFGSTSGNPVNLDLQVTRATGVHSGLSGVTAVSTGTVVSSVVPAVPATGTITIGGTWRGTDSVTAVIGGRIYTFTAPGVLTDSVTVTAMAAGLATAINADTGRTVNATSVAGVITLTAIVAGTAGNAIPVTVGIAGASGIVGTAAFTSAAAPNLAGGLAPAATLSGGVGAISAVHGIGAVAATPAFGATTLTVNVTTAAAGAFGAGNNVAVTTHVTAPATSITAGEWATAGVRTVTVGSTTGIAVGDIIRTDHTTTHATATVLNIISATVLTVNITAASAAPGANVSVLTHAPVVTRSIDTNWRTAGAGRTITVDSTVGIASGDTLTVFMTSVDATRALGTVTLTEAFATGDVITVAVGADGGALGGTATRVVALGDTVTTIADALRATIHGFASVDATNVGGVITITAASTGTTGNAITLAASVAKVGGAVVVAGNPMTVRQTVPTVTTVGRTGAVLRGTENVLMTVTVAANAAGDVHLQTLGISALTGIAAGGAALSISDFIVREGATVVADRPHVAGVITFGDAVATPLIIAAGTSRTFEISAVTNRVAVTGDSISSQLVRAGFTWGDSAANLGLGDALITVLPSVSTTISF